MNWIDPWGFEVVYNGNVLGNQETRSILESIDKALPTSDVIVTGGDRYVDSNGNIRSTTNNSIIPNSYKYSTHLMGTGVDFYISNYTPSEDFLSQYFGNVKYYDDGHIHGDFGQEGRYCTAGNRN